MAPVKVQTTTEADLERLVKMLALLASNQAGERAVAALKVSEFVRARGIEWGDLVFPPEPALQPVTVTVGGQSVASAQAQAEIARLRQDVADWRSKAAATEGARAHAQVQLNLAQEELQAYHDVVGPLRRHPATGKPWKPVNPPQPSAPATATLRPIPAWGSAAPKPRWVLEVLKFLAGHRHLVRGDREDAFLCDLVTRGKPGLTDKQEEWLRKILARAGLSI